MSNRMPEKIWVSQKDIDILADVASERLRSAQFCQDNPERFICDVRRAVESARSGKIPNKAEVAREFLNEATRNFDPLGGDVLEDFIEETLKEWEDAESK